MNLHNKTLLITGANRGIGQALVTAALSFGVKKVYASARSLASLPEFNDPRVVPLQLDITNNASIHQAVSQASDVNVLVNNAGVLAFASVLSGEPADLHQDMNVNYFGTLAVTRAFLPVLERNGDAAIASISSIIGLASMAPVGGYSASKAALASAIQSMRAELTAKKIAVFGVFPGPIETDMSREFDMPKTSPAQTAHTIYTQMEQGLEDIFPDAMSAAMGEVWKTNPKGLERQFSAQ